ncbi:hypothetical protein STEG23_023463 [Scotinomys teguina]
MCRLSWFLDPGGWGKAAVVGLYFIFPGICTLSLVILVKGSFDPQSDCDPQVESCWHRESYTLDKTASERIE